MSFDTQTDRLVASASTTPDHDRTEDHGIDNVRPDEAGGQRPPERQEPQAWPTNAFEGFGSFST